MKIFSNSLALVVGLACSLACSQAQVVQIGQEVTLPDIITQATLSLGLPFCLSTSSLLEDVLPAASASPPTLEYTLVHFASMDLANSCSLELADSAGVVVTTFHGQEEDVWSLPVFDSSICLTMTCEVAADVATSSFAVDRLIGGIPLIDLDLPDNGLERRDLSLLRGGNHHHHHHRDLAICGNADFDSAVDYQDSSNADEREMYETSKTVAYLIIGRYVCTGFLIGDHTMLTAKHCFTSDGSDYDPSAIGRLSATFLYERSGTSSAERNSNTYAGASILAVSSNEDWISFSVRPDSFKGVPGDRFGSLQVDSTMRRADRQIFIPQHPQGRLKEITSKDTSESTGMCNINRVSGDRYYYLCDTQGGSSGSPVIDFATHQVIAVHTAAAGCSWGNTGVATASFVDELPAQQPAPTPGPVSNPTPAPVVSCQDDPNWRGLFGMTCSSFGACLVSGSSCPASCGGCP